MSDVVGYQGKPLKNGDFTWSTGTFVDVGKTGDKMVLKDVKLVRTEGDMSCGAVYLYLLGANGANMKITDETSPFKGLEATFVYLDEVEAEEWQAEEGYEYVTAGWYHETDQEYVHPMDNYPIAYGLGYAVKSIAEDYVIQWAGQVEIDANMPVISLKNGDFTWTGNAAPTNLKLKDFVLTRTEGDMSCGAVYLYFLGTNGANMKITDEESPFKGFEATFVYLDEVEAEEWQAEEGYEYVTAGWYHETDQEYVHPMNNYPVDAALGFAVKSIAEGYQFQLPGAL